MFTIMHTSYSCTIRNHTKNAGSEAEPAFVHSYNNSEIRLFDECEPLT